MDDITAPEDISEVEEEEKVPSASTAPEQREEGVLTEHDGDKAREIEAAFNTQERTEGLKQEAHDEGKEMARRAQEVSQPPPQPVQEVPKPPTQGAQQPEHLQTQPEQQPERPQTHPLTNAALASSEQRAILREKLRAENGEVKKPI